MKQDAFYDQLKSQTEDWEPYSLDPSYTLMRETVRALKILPLEQIDVADLDMLYIMSVGTWGSSVRNKKKKIATSHLLENEKKRLNALLDELVEANKAGKYRHHESSETFGIFGRGFGTFARGKAPYPPEHAQRFIKMCCDIIDEEDEERIFSIVEPVLKENIRNLGPGSATQILHLLKPYVFPVMNRWGKRIYRKALGLPRRLNLPNYVANTRDILKIRNEHFGFRNLIVIDQALHNLDVDDETTIDDAEVEDEINDADEDVFADVPAGFLENVNVFRWFVCAI